MSNKYGLYIDDSAVNPLSTKWYCIRHDREFDISDTIGVGVTLIDSGVNYHFGRCCLIEFFSNNMHPLIKLRENDCKH